jgi:hypothetical protein
MDQNPYRSPVDAASFRARDATAYEWSPGPMRLLMLSLIGLLVGCLALLCALLGPNYGAVKEILGAGGSLVVSVSSLAGAVALFGLLLQFLHYLLRS